MYVIGEFQQKEAAAQAIRSLRAVGLSTGNLDLFSEEPVEFPRGLLDRPSRLSLVSVSGAIFFGLCATAFIYYTQHDYKLVTGGMPLFSFWATGVVTYEMTMFGAIIAAFAWFLWESGLVRKRDREAPIPDVNPGAMCLRVRCEPERACLAVDIMRCAGAVQIDGKGDSVEVDRKEES